MFNLQKWVKSWFTKQDNIKLSSHNNIKLEEARKEYGETSEDQPMIAEKTIDRPKSDSVDVIIEQKMNKENKNDTKSLEAQIDDSLTYSKRTEDGSREEVTRTSVATEKYDQEYREAYAKAEKELKKQKDLFEKYMGKKGAKKVPTNVEPASSGLVNTPERFVNFDGVPTNDVKKNISNIGNKSSVKPMHILADLDTIKKLDAATFHIAYKAASSGRDMNKQEIDILGKIIKKKRELLK